MDRRQFAKGMSVQALAVAALPAAVLRHENVSVSEVKEDSLQQASSDIVDLFRRHMELDKVRAGETVVYYSTPGFERKEYIDATLAAAKLVGANAFSLVAASGQEESPLLESAFKSASIVYGQIPLYTDAHNAALAAGTRTLMVTEEVANLRRMFPDPKVIQRTYAGARRMRDARQIRVTDRAGSDFTLRKAGRKGHAQVGISDSRGRWDHWPSGLVACAPLEDGVDGRYVISPGDVILGLRRYATEPVTINLAGGRITLIEGGYEAQMIRERLESFVGAPAPAGKLNDPFRVAHAGWGTEHRAQWHTMGMDSESMYGNVMISLGRNMFDSGDQLAGLGGQNYTPVHIDICCRNKRLYLDGELVIDDNKIVVPELA